MLKLHTNKNKATVSIKSNIIIFHIQSTVSYQLYSIKLDITKDVNNQAIKYLYFYSIQYRVIKNYKFSITNEASKSDGEDATC